jgi:integrase
MVPARAALAKATTGEVPDYVTVDEVHRALDGLADRPRVRAFLRALWLTGGRVSEVLAVKVADLDIRARAVTLATLKRRTPTARTIPLPDSFVGELALLAADAQLARGDRLFPWSRSRAFELVRDALLAAGVDRPRAHPHALRHGHAIHAIQHHVPLNIIQRAMGHALISTTSIYLEVTGEDVRRAYAHVDW